ncbi:ACT domain-containing protein [Actinomadura viridis]|uniref:CASTOR ACT domain-containing protein n=1 Tax=Actinomadura viridis TaxID=58110 RepID=A0A931GHR7_9ACTN|nr:ACT domain-containing protein [Actinomadura viridis]MBG6087620.1 hypothetical protein [Actinomadura viridis]
MTSPPSHRFHLVRSPFSVDFVPEATFPDDDEWIALVRVPEGLTVIREAPPFGDGTRWAGLLADRSHTPDATAALAALTGALAAAGLPVLAVTTHHGDLVLVPERRVTEAAAALKEAGHEVVEPPA